MRLLLDTHVFLWTQTAPDRLGDVLEELRDPQRQLFLSAASTWEIAIKYQLGKLPLPDRPSRYIPDLRRRLGASALGVEESHGLRVASIPPLHRDPFDRMLVAQALALEMTIVTADRLVAQYDVPTMFVV